MIDIYTYQWTLYDLVARIKERCEEAKKELAQLPEGSPNRDFRLGVAFAYCRCYEMLKRHIVFFQIPVQGIDLQAHNTQNEKNKDYGPWATLDPRLKENLIQKKWPSDAKRFKQLLSKIEKGKQKKRTNTLPYKCQLYELVKHLKEEFRQCRKELAKLPKDSPNRYLLEGEECGYYCSLEIFENDFILLPISLKEIGL